MSNVEHKVFDWDANDLEGLEAELNKHGAEGYELLTVHTFTKVVMRKVTE